MRYFRETTVPIKVTNTVQNVLGSTEVAVHMHKCFHVTVGDIPQEFVYELFQTNIQEPPTQPDKGQMFEIGPLPNFETAWSTNVQTVCQAIDLKGVKVMQTRFIVISGAQPTDAQSSELLSKLHDPMTECKYEDGQPMATKLQPFDGDVAEADLEQSGSEHSRHWFFKGKMVFDGKEKDKTLMELVQTTLSKDDKNSCIAFSDNSSAIKGYKVPYLSSATPGQPSPLDVSERDMLVTLTAETHNFPTAIAPLPGAETGTGGRLRDQHATGRGSLVVAGTVGYSVGNLHIPGYPLAWEQEAGICGGHQFASALDIEIQASNGASDYGNKFGEPVIVGYTRSLGIKVGDERREYIKPIMFSGGIGSMFDEHKSKALPEEGMVVIKVGGPAYRIGFGGSAASSTNVQTGGNLDAVQRGDAEMEQKVNRVIRSCVEMGHANPILSIHDQGAGGNGNVLKEIVEPTGAVVNLDKLVIGDTTMTAVELWCCEYQENDAVLLRADDVPQFDALCKREGVPYAVVGEVVQSGTMVVTHKGKEVCNIPLEVEESRRTFEDTTQASMKAQSPISIDASVPEALDSVLHLLGVGSKAFLTVKVDRCVSGLIAQQQCVGPLHLPLSDYAVVSLSHYTTKGACTSIGEQPLKGLVDASAMARMAVAEAVTNMSLCAITSLSDVKCSANWMWAAKLPGEAVAMYNAVEAMSACMKELGIAVDGGKDSLSMAVQTGEGVVKSPGTLVVSLYCTVDDIRAKVTPDIAHPGKSKLVLLHCSPHHRLGGSALGQCYNQLGDVVPDVDDPKALLNMFNVVQSLIKSQSVTAGHDRSDGGLATTLVEMAFGGNCGLDIQLSSASLEVLFAEEVGVVLEVLEDKYVSVVDTIAASGVPFVELGSTTVEPTIIIRDQAGTVVLQESTKSLLMKWSETSFQIDALQANPACVSQEKKYLESAKGPVRNCTFDPVVAARQLTPKPKVAILREEGTNGDREMSSAFINAGFEAWDVKMIDLQTGSITLDQFSGAAFAGGFSFADVLGAAKGWSSVIRHGLLAQFNAFRDRSDTFSLGVCNGCQLLTDLGWVKGKIEHNTSARFECRWSSVRIEPSSSIFLANMVGSTLGIWTAHGEGKFTSHEDAVAAVFVDEDNEPTTAYPMNPNGSMGGIAALTSDDGRSMAIMPHPERCYIDWQCPERNPIPWARMFANAFDWVQQQQQQH